MSWDPAAVQSGGRSPIVPVIALDASADAVSPPTLSGRVAAGDVPFRWYLDGA